MDYCCCTAVEYGEPLEYRMCINSVRFLTFFLFATTRSAVSNFVLGWERCAIVDMVMKRLKSSPFASLVLHHSGNCSSKDVAQISFILFHPQGPFYFISWIEIYDGWYLHTAGSVYMRRSGLVHPESYKKKSWCQKKRERNRLFVLRCEWNRAMNIVSHNKRRILRHTK